MFEALKAKVGLRKTIASEGEQSYVEVRARLLNEVGESLFIIYARTEDETVAEDIN